MFFDYVALVFFRAMCGSGISGLIYWWHQSPDYGFHFTPSVIYEALCYAMCHVQVSLVVLITLFRFLNCRYPAIMQLHSSISVETSIFGHHSNVQCLLHQEFLMSTSSVLNLSVIPLIRVVMFPCMLSNGGLLQLPATAGISVLSCNWR